MAVSARLSSRTRLALDRYCRNRGVTKTEAIERGIELLMREEREESHPAYAAFERLRSELERAVAPPADERGSAAFKHHLDEKYRP
jgi:hypothetical protein